MTATEAAQDTAEAERLLKIKKEAEAKGDTPAEGLVDEDLFCFVVFDGGDKSIAEIKLKKDAPWTEMKEQLVAKMGQAEASHTVYGVRYVDPTQEGKTSMVRNEEEWQKCWHVVVGEKDRELEVDVIQSPPVKPYKLTLKIDADKKKGEKKKIYYPNVYDTDITYKILVEGDTLSIKEKTLAVPKNDKGAIVLRFVPMDAATEETILVKLQEEGSGIEHTVKVNASWS